MIVPTPPSTPPTPYTPTDERGMSDIFQDSPKTTAAALDSGFDEPSESRRLEMIHTTAGYREGVSSGKDQTLQAGFDDGYMLGAQFGMKIGYLLGLIEGLWRLGANETSMEKLSHARNQTTRKTLGKTRIGLLRQRAIQELDLDNIFTPALFTTDGHWMYEVPEVESDGKDQLQSVVNAHPVIASWAKVLDDEMSRAQLQRDVLSPCHQMQLV